MKKYIKKKICFDIDNVICKTKNSNYKKSKPILLAIKKINQLYKKNYIILFTARFMGRTNNNVLKAKKHGYSLTKKQLKKWGVKYHQLIMGKPSYDLIVDDLAIYFKKTWYKEIDKYL
tara:strand:+ start:430 stop:783 length:354 start_codon:yes stop_codon:yes gene_type:complete